MEFLSHVLPIIIYFLLIILIVIGIIFGIKLIIFMDKVQVIADDINEKVAKVTPIFDTIGIVSNRFSSIVNKTVSGVENILFKLFVNKKKNKKEMESEENE